MSTCGIRLLRNVLPRQYRLTFLTDLVNCTFRGSVDIDLHVCAANQTEIELHAAEHLTVEKPTVQSRLGLWKELSFRRDAERETIVVTLPQALERGTHDQDFTKISFAFRGPLTDDLVSQNHSSPC